eukprot:2340193-Pyramimonas_sp.AAC.1
MSYACGDCVCPFPKAVGAARICMDGGEQGWRIWAQTSLSWGASDMRARGGADTGLLEAASHAI